MNWTTRDMPGLLKLHDAAAVVHVSGVVDVKREDFRGTSITAEDPEDEPELARHLRNSANTPLQTTYSGEVREWLQASGPEKISLVAPGGLADLEAPDGSISKDQAIFPDGMFLLEPGRSYLLLLDETEDGAYAYGMAFAAFDLTAGVHVLNHPLTRDIEYYEAMSVDEFVAYVKSLAAEAATAD
jgi:hypothetical protein